MKATSRERGQALILIVFGIVGMLALTGLAVDGGMAYNDRRTAQTAADTAALAAALANVRGGVIDSTAKGSASQAGYDDNHSTNNVTVSVVNLPSGTCPYSAPGKDITVDITSHVKTYFGPVIGIRELTNTVRSTARSCESYEGPVFNGDAIVALGPSGIGYDAAGNPNWLVEGGGIFSNSSSNPSARCKGASDVSAPSLTTVGGVTLTCSTEIANTSTGVSQYQYADYSGMLPRVPACDGVATLSGGFWQTQSGADGSRVAFSGDMQFAPGLYCVTNSPGPYHGQISGSFVSFYLVPSNFSLKFNGGGNLTATAPTSGEFGGVLMFSAPQFSGGVLQQTQSIDVRGNGTGDITGSIIVPSAAVTMFGNSNSNGYKSQVIGYKVDSGGEANIHINYNAGLGYQASNPAWLRLQK
jgi:Flp pilus assembly protein TadG